jgi:NADH dehydrogenase
MILVTGAAGFIGRHLVTRLIAEGRRVRCLLPPRALTSFTWTPAPDITTGTLFDDEALFQAVTGAHTIIHLESAQWWGRERDLERVDLEGTRSLIAAARAARVGRILILSHLGAAQASAYSLMRIKGSVEEAVKASGLAYTILRCGMVFGEDDAFINHIAMQLAVTPGFFLMPGQGEVALHPLYVEDLVSAVIGSLERMETVDQVLEIGGPEYITLEDLLRTVMRVSGQPRMIIAVPPYVVRWITGLYARLLPRSLITAQWLDLLATHRTARLGNMFQYFGLQPRRLEDTLMTYMRGHHYGAEALRYTFRRRPRAT